MTTSEQNSVPLDPAAPPPEVWRRIERRIEPDRTTPSQGGLWNNLTFWGGLGITAAMLMLVFGLSLVGLRQEPEELPRVMMVLNDLWIR